jgi:UDP-N-acetylglucosamine acyltransferase
VKGPACIGRNNRIFQFASIGEAPPALGDAVSPTSLDIGDDNVIREGVTIQRGTGQGHPGTVIGNDTMLLAHVDVGHDCRVGDHVHVANGAALAEHVVVGAYARIGSMSLVSNGVPAFVNVGGNPARAIGLNNEGLRQRGFSERRIAALRAAYSIVYARGLTVADALTELQSLAADDTDVGVFAASITASHRGIVRGSSDDSDD